MCIQIVLYYYEVIQVLKNKTCHYLNESYNAPEDVFSLILLLGQS